MAYPKSALRRSSNHGSLRRMDRPSQQPEIADDLTNPGDGFPAGAPEYFFHLLFQAAQRRDILSETLLAPTGLTLMQWRALAVIRRIENCTMTGLARYSGAERTTLTRTVDQLVERDFVARWVPAADRRQINLAVTEAGEMRFAEAAALMRARNGQALANISPRRLRDATHFLQLLLQGLVEDDAIARDLLSFSRPEGAPRP
jgi:DNA-binding MarR family transcriptional regulator